MKIPQQINTSNYNDMMKEFAETEKEIVSDGIKRYDPSDMDDFEAEMKRMEEEELAGVEFEQVDEEVVKAALGVKGDKIKVERLSKNEMDIMVEKATKIDLEAKK